MVLAGAAVDARGEPVSRCGSAEGGSGRVVRIVDGQSFVLDDGRDIRLAALDIPMEPGKTAAAAETALAALVSGRTVVLRSTGAPDRYGRTVAHVIVPGSGPISHAMLREGYARVSGQTGDPACAAELLGQERVARAARLGLWADPRYAMIEAQNLTDLVAGRGRFAVVEGTVRSVRRQGGTIYVNFGRRWSQALTVTISKRQERIFTAAGRAPPTLDHRRLRVRGFVEVRGGPRIEASRPEQIEFAEP